MEQELLHFQESKLSNYRQGKWWERERDKAKMVPFSDSVPHMVHHSTTSPKPAVTAICNSQMYLNIRHSRTRYVVYGCVCLCVHMWLFTQGPLENAARVSEACRPADEVKGFRVSHNSPLSICPQGEWTLRNDTVAALVQGEEL